MRYLQSVGYYAVWPQQVVKVARKELRYCQYCGHSSLHWEMHDFAWRLYKPDGKIHRCKVHPLPRGE